MDISTHFEWYRVISASSYCEGFGLTEKRSQAYCLFLLLWESFSDLLLYDLYCLVICELLILLDNDWFLLYVYLLIFVGANFIWEAEGPGCLRVNWNPNTWCFLFYSAPPPHICVHGEGQRTICSSIFSYQVDPQNQTEVIRHHGKCLSAELSYWCCFVFFLRQSFVLSNHRLAQSLHFSFCLSLLSVGIVLSCPPTLNLHVGFLRRDLL